MSLNNRLKRLEQQEETGRVYEIVFVASAEEAEQISKERNYPPWQEGERPRFIIDDSGWLEEWRKDYAELERQTSTN